MAKQQTKIVQEERKVIRETKYCKLCKSVSIIDGNYYSSIEKIIVKEKERKNYLKILPKLSTLNKNRKL